MLNNKASEAKEQPFHTLVWLDVLYSKFSRFVFVEKHEISKMSMGMVEKLLLIMPFIVP